MEKALEHLNRSAHAGNEFAALALTRMANNQFLAVATNVLDLVAPLVLPLLCSFRKAMDVLVDLSFVSGYKIRDGVNVAEPFIYITF